MDIAYDKKRKCDVMACDLKEEDRGSFRYQCKYCGEDLILVLPKRRGYSKYFKHKDGNNDKECKEYYKTLEVNSKYILRESENNSRIELFFNGLNKNFYIGILLYSEELDDLKEKNSYLTIMNGSKKIIDNFTINQAGLIRDSFTYFRLNSIFENNYIKIGKKSYNFSLFNKNKNLSFFRMSFDSNYAKYAFMESSDVTNLYIGTYYFVVSRDKNSIKNLLDAASYNKREISEFTHVGSKFYFTKIIFKEVNLKIEKILNKSEYRLLNREYIDVIWPPVYVSDNTLVSNSDDVYLYSSFRLKEYENTNSKVSLINKSNLYRLYNNDTILIGKRNVDIKIVKDKELKNRPEIKDVIKKEAKYIKISESSHNINNNLDNDRDGNLVLKDYDYYLFDYSGCRKLQPGEKLVLYNDSKIVGYENRHKRVEITSLKEMVPTEEDKVLDALRYYPKEEHFIENDFKRCKLSPFMKNYLKDCKEKGQINSAVKKYIKDEVLWII